MLSEQVNFYIDPNIGVGRISPAVQMLCEIYKIKIATSYN